jgi:alpha,alpha-trehalase
MTGYPPIAEHGFLSDCHTGALVGPDGAIDWLCAPRFDSPSLFARLLDRKRGGCWEIEVAGADEPKSRYLDSTLIVESRWRTAEAEVVCHDFLALKSPGAAGARGVVPEGVLVRLVRCEGGAARVGLRLDARPDYGRRRLRWQESGETLVAAGEDELWLSGEPRPTLQSSDGVAVTAAELRAGDAIALGLGYRGGSPRRVDRVAAERLFAETVDAWRGWSARSDYDGYAAREVHHSALVLRGLMFDESGAMLAAPTTSLPEWIGGERNWDYRYAWHRDAALVVMALLRLGHEAEAERYLRFLLEHCAHCDDELEPMLAIDGGTEMPERVLEHLEGYRGSGPVRVGNEARSQHQLDSYGQVADAALAFHRVTGGLSAGDLAELRRIGEMARHVWSKPDHGKWEVRGRGRHWVHSKLYAWVCLDRCIKVAELCGDREAPLEAWRSDREAIRGELLARGWNEKVGSFVQSYGAANVDASLLRLPLVGFANGDDPRVVSTIRRVEEELGEAGYLIRRYDPEATRDGVGGEEGAFLLCSFDMVSALVLAGREEEARARFETLCERAPRFGLFSEEMDADGVMLGNYPQAFTHLALIDAAINLDQAGDRDALHEWAERGEHQLAID